jgi:hypothetical protein
VIPLALTAAIAWIIFFANGHRPEHHELTPLPPGFAEWMADGWIHGETLGATNVVEDQRDEDTCGVAGVIVGGPLDGGEAAWSVSPCSAVGDPATGRVIAMNSVAQAVNRKGERWPLSFSADFPPEAVFEALAGLPPPDRP